MGTRAMLVAPLGRNWALELTGAYQQIDHQDARYAEGRAAPPARRSAISQPAGNAFALGGMTIRKKWDSGLELVSASSIVGNSLRARYDLSTIVPGVSNETRNRATVLSHETRLSRPIGQGGWLLGVHVVSSTDRMTTELTSGTSSIRGSNVGNGVVDAALFGQATFPVLPRWTATIGGRLSYSEARSFGRLPDGFDTDRLSVLGGGVVRALPSVALGWRPRSGTTVYVRYQRGYRVGGLTIQPITDPTANIPDFTVNVFRPDHLDMVEGGLRFGRAGISPVSGTLAVSAARWMSIQADLFDLYGPYTTNVGDGRIFGLEGSVGWRATPSLTLSAAAFIADSSLYRSEDASVPIRREWLPNIPAATMRLDGEWRGKVGANDLTVGARLRYVGRSRLGVGDLSIRQGNYLEAGVGAEIGRDGRALFVDVDNLLDVRGNRFALGNPFTAVTGDQRTPLQPRTVRIGVRRSF
jgi:hypothetical protein